LPLRVRLSLENVTKSLYETLKVPEPTGVFALIGALSTLRPAGERADAIGEFAMPGDDRFIADAVRIAEF
jgi:hypothetical protein